MKSAGPSPLAANPRPRSTHAPPPDRAHGYTVHHGNLARSLAQVPRAAQLAEPMRRRAEASLGIPLSAIRLERGSAEPDRSGAVALSTGRRIKAAFEASEEDIAHELVHVAQGLRHGTVPGAPSLNAEASPAEAEARELAPHVLQGRPASVRRPRDAVVHRKPQDKKEKKEKKDDPEFVITPVGMNAGALGRYLTLRDAVDPADWNALSAAARRREEKISAGGVAPAG